MHDTTPRATTQVDQQARQGRSQSPDGSTANVLQSHLSARLSDVPARERAGGVGYQ